MSGAELKMALVHRKMGVAQEWRRMNIFILLVYSILHFPRLTDDLSTGMQKLTQNYNINLTHLDHFILHYLSFNTQSDAFVD